MAQAAARFSDTLEEVKTQGALNGLSLKELIGIAGEKGHIFFILFIVLPFLQPIPLVGLSTLGGIAIAFAGILMSLNKPVFLPERFSKARIEHGPLLKICGVLEKVMIKIEKWVKPRNSRLFHVAWVRKLHGVSLAFHGVLLALPLPIPVSNFLPALVIFLTALSFLEEDAAVLALSYVALLVNAAFFIALVLLPYLGIKALA